MHEYQAHEQCGHLEAVVLVDDIVESAVHLVEKSDDLKRLDLVADGRKVDNVGKHDRHLLERLRVDGALLPRGGKGVAPSSTTVLKTECKIQLTPAKTWIESKL